MAHPVAVRLLSNVGHYEAGTVCGWSEEVAASLVARRLAVYMVQPEAPAPVVAAAIHAAPVAAVMGAPKAKAKKV